MTTRWMPLLTLLLLAAAAFAQPQPIDNYRTYLDEGRKAIAAQDYPRAERALTNAAFEANMQGLPATELVVLNGLLVDAYRFQGKYAEAQPVLEELVRQYAILPDMEKLGQASARLGRIDRLLHDDARAETDLQQGITLIEEAGDTQHPALLTLLPLLADLYCDTNREAKAEPLRQRALKLAQGLQPPDPLAVARRATELGKCCRRQRKWVPAATYFRQALAVVQTLRPPDPFPEHEALLGLARSEDGLGQPANATAHYQQALAVLVRFFGTESPSLVRSFARVAAAYAEAGRAAEAEALYQRTLVMAERVYRDSEETAKVLDQYAAFYTATGKPDKAAPLTARAKAIRAQSGK